MAEFDPLRILAGLRAHGVNYVLIGGLAAAAHGSPLETDDVDVCLGPADGNPTRPGPPRPARTPAPGPGGGPGPRRRRRRRQGLVHDDLRSLGLPGARWPLLGAVLE